MQTQSRCAAKKLVKSSSGPFISTSAGKLKGVKAREIRLLPPSADKSESIFVWEDNARRGAFSGSAFPEWEGEIRSIRAPTPFKNEEIFHGYISCNAQCVSRLAVVIFFYGGQLSLYWWFSFLSGWKNIALRRFMWFIFNMSSVIKMRANFFVIEL